MLSDKAKRYTWLTGVWLAGILLALGSKSYDPEIEVELLPVVVNFSVTTDGGGFEFQDGVTVDKISNADLGGTFSKAANSRISLREVPVTLDTSSVLIASISATDPDNALVLSGDLSMSISENLEFGINRGPEQGQISVLFDDTTTLVTFDGNNNNVMLQTGSAAATILTYSNFRNDYSDEDLGFAHRMASKAYRLAENIWLTARMSETLQSQINDQLDMLEAIGVNTNLSLTCNNTTSTRAPENDLRWLDSTGTGLGTAGNNDRFSNTWRNCENTSDDRFLEGGLELSNYQFNNDISPRSMSFTANFSLLYFATQEILESPIPSTTRERADGNLVISVNETVSTTQ